MSSDFIEFLVEKGIELSVAKQVAPLFLEKIIKDLDETGSSVIRNFGRFESCTIPSAKRRNPSTGEYFQSSEKKTVRFKVSKVYRDRIGG